MSTTAKRALWVVLLLACAGLVWLALSGTLAIGRAPISAAPSPAASASGTPAPESAAPTVAPSTSAPAWAAAPSQAPAEGSEPAAEPSDEAAPSPEPTEAEASSTEPAEVEAPSTKPAEADAPAWQGLMTGPAAPWESIDAAPVHVEVHQDGERIVGASVEHTQMNEAGELDPDPQTVGWYGAPQWGTDPGERSPYAGILAGHVVYYGVKDVFWNLDAVRAGDVVVLTYDDGSQAVFEADADAVSVEKEALTQDPANRWAWEPGGDDARLTLITCDLVPGTGMAGNAFNNWVVQATRVA